MARRGFQHHRLLSIKDLFLNLKALALRQSEDQQRVETRRLGKTKAEKEEHLAKAPLPSADAVQPLFPRDLQVSTWYTEQLNDDMQRQVHLVQLAEQEVQSQRKVVEVSAKEKQTLEKLKEHQEREARREEGREEQRQLDEIASRKRSLTGKPERP